MLEKVSFWSPKYNLVQLKKGSGFCSKSKEADIQRIKKKSERSLVGANISFFEAKPDFSDYLCLSSNMVNYLPFSPLRSDSFLIKLLCLNPKQTTSLEQLATMFSGVCVMMAGHFSLLSLLVSVVPSNHFAGEGPSYFVLICWYSGLAVTRFFLIF